MKKKILEMKGITKFIFDAYGKAIKNSNVKILSDVNLCLYEAEVHVIVGENGAGKSTLMKILDGIIPQDEGQMLLDGKPLIIKGPKEAKDKGIVFIHQELNLCLNLDIAHNIFLSREPKNGIFVDKSEMYRKSRELLDSLGFGELDPHTIVRNLSIAQQQVVEIVKAISLQSRIIIMDEPTASLSQKEIDHLFELIRDVKKKGVSVIYISHRFDELVTIGDRLTVLRDGKSIKTIDMKQFDYDEVVKLMVGRTIGDMYQCTHQVSDEVVLELKNLKITEKSEPLNLTVKKGEVVGIGGLVGSGRTELAKCIFGGRKKYSGEVIYKGNVYDKISPIRSIQQHIAYLSEDRKLEGLITEMTIRENISLASMRKIFKGKIVNRSIEKKHARQGIKELNIICRSMEQLVNTLSGGNQQKVLFSKWLTLKPELLILDEPTRGIDVNAKAEIYKIIDVIAKQGVAVMMISSELPELIGMSDRIYVMRHATISLEIDDKKEMHQERILQYTLC